MKSDEIMEGLTSSEVIRIADSLQQLDLILRKEEAGAEFIPVLCRLLAYEDAIKSKALWCLGKLGQNKVADPSSLPHIHGLSDDRDPENRENMAWALGEMAGAGVGDYASLEVLIDLLDDEDPHVKSMAAWSLGRYATKLDIRSKRCLDGLESMAESPSQMIRKSAEFALERIRGLERS